jgi:dihydrodipicolinate synthase/N-acetylneuraminate lyase
MPAAPEQRRGRQIAGMSAVLLPFTADGVVDWSAFEAHVARTAKAGLVPAVNMDTGYVQLLGRTDRERALGIAADVTGGDFVAGAHVADGPGDPFDHAALVREATAVRALGGTPVVFPSNGLNALADEGWVAALAAFGDDVDRFIGFELGSMFVPYGRIVGLEAYEGLLDIDACIGAKHSSLDRQAEWDRLALRDRIRPDFRVLTGNDLAIDMVVYGSDYLLGLATFAPELFAIRDRLWATDDARFWEVNDVLQYLGMFAFRPPVPAYRHDAAIFLELRGWAASDRTPEGVPRRPDADRGVLADIASRVDALVEELG